ncbi:MAG: cobalt-precorrin-5B (C(1))-methyltransferase CbiD [Tissierellia bacterium]|nr:cobalt-precorrin-5B (C(1))-methyltransferase CbiD [Tissierellia bacterium]
MDEFIIAHGQKLRMGYTTGSCAQAATKAAALFLLTGEAPEQVDILTPSGKTLSLEVFDPQIQPGEWASVAIEKDAGDDPDVTDGIRIYAKVSPYTPGEVKVDGGLGVGRIIRKGLFSDVGDAAINPVPRKKILEELKALGGGLQAEISVPQGEAIAKRTFNSRIGIEGGISILGTTGIVTPMSDDAIKKTIYMELDQSALTELEKGILLTPGNYGEKLAAELKLPYKSVQTSNYMGDALLYAQKLGFRRFVILGHVGKLAKLSIGIFQTHSRTADSRMEAFVYYMAMEGMSLELLQEIDGCLTAEEAAGKLQAWGFGQILQRMREGIIERVKTYLKEEVEVEVILYTMEGGVL